MKVRELKEIIDRALEQAPDRDWADTMVRFAQPVEASDVEWETTVEVGQDFDRYHEDTLRDVPVTVYFDIEDWEADYNVADLVDADKAVVQLDVSWNRKTRSISLKEFREKLDSVQEDKDVVWTAGGAASGNWSDSAGIDWVGNERTKRKFPFYGDATGSKKYSAAITLGTDDVDEDPPFEAIQQYADEHEDSIQEMAYERAESSYDGPDDYDEDWED